MSFRQVAEKVRISEAAVRHHYDDPEIRAMVERMCAARIEAGRRALATLVPQAVMTYQKVMQTAATAVPAASLPTLLGKQTDAADSVLDRVGLVRSSKVEQTGRVLQVNAEAERYADFEGKSAEDLLFYGVHGRWPDDPSE